MTSRPIVLVILLIIIIIVPQFEWKQQLAKEVDVNPNIPQKQQQTMKREEVVKEKIILSQEKRIQRLDQLVQRLQQQLVQCQDANDQMITSGSSLTTNVNEIERQEILDD